MRVAVAVPARWRSSRYPGKPLVALRGASGRPMSLLERSWRAASSAEGVDRVAILTDDSRIMDAAAAFGAEAIETPESCRNGTERCAAALPALEPVDLVVNLQGDAPLTPPWFVEALIDAMKADPDLAVATPVLRCDPAAHAAFVEDRAAGRVGGTTAVFDENGRALYFSKEVLPFTGRRFGTEEETPVFHHVGCYAYRPDALRDYAGRPEGRLERWEGLEQLRFLEAGLPVACVEVEARGRTFWEVNNPEDVPRVEAALSAAGID